MGRLVYTAIASLDGYVADERGTFDWCAPMPRCTRSSTTSSARSGRISTGAGCTRSSPCGRRWTRDGADAVIRDFARDLAGGRQDRRQPHARPGLHRPYDAARRSWTWTSCASASELAERRGDRWTHPRRARAARRPGRRPPPVPLAGAWSAAACGRCPPGCASTSSWPTSIASRTGSCTCTTSPYRGGRFAPTRRGGALGAGEHLRRLGVFGAAHLRRGRGQSGVWVESWRVSSGALVRSSDSSRMASACAVGSSLPAVCSSGSSSARLSTRASSGVSSHAPNLPPRSAPPVCGTMAPVTAP